jgi:carboxymethylenebutenolidase
VPTVGTLEFRDREIACGRIYWDQACVLAQVGLLDAGALPMAGAESARKLLESASVSSEFLIRRGEEG